MDKVHDINLDEIEWPDVNDVPDVDWREEWERFYKPLHERKFIAYFVSAIALVLTIIGIIEGIPIFYIVGGCGAIYMLMLPKLLLWSNWRYREIFKQQRKVPAFVQHSTQQGLPDTGLVRFSVRAKLENNSIRDLSFYLHNNKGPLKSVSMKDWIFPEEGDPIILYYSEKYPRICYPVTSQLIR